MFTAKSLAIRVFLPLIVLNTVVLADVLAQGPAPALDAPRTDQVVRRFYDAINTAIATGNETPLLEVTAAGYFEEDPVPGFSSDRSGLLQRVKALRELDSGLRLVISQVETSGSTASVSIEVQGGTSKFAALNRSALWRGRDLLRVAGNVVRERLGAGPEIVVMTPDCALEIPRASDEVVVRFTRLQLSPRMSTRIPASAGESGLILVSGNAMLVTRPKNASMTQSDAELTDLPPATVLGGDSGTPRIVAGESGATLLLISQLSVSRLGAPRQDLSMFDQGAAVSAAHPELISYGSHSLDLRCYELLLLPGVQAHVPTGENEIIVADPSLARCATEESESAAMRRFHNYHAGPLSVMIVELMTEPTNRPARMPTPGSASPARPI